MRSVPEAVGRVSALELDGRLYRWDYCEVVRAAWRVGCWRNGLTVKGAAVSPSSEESAMQVRTGEDSAYSLSCKRRDELRGRRVFQGRQGQEDVQNARDSATESWGLMSASPFSASAVVPAALTSSVSAPPGPSGGSWLAAGFAPQLRARAGFTRCDGCETCPAAEQWGTWSELRELAAESSKRRQIDCS